LGSPGPDYLDHWLCWSEPRPINNYGFLNESIRIAVRKYATPGLWKYSRHPNYFFEWVLWLGYIPLGILATGGPWLFLIPPVLYLFLAKVTGIPFVEARKLEASGEEYKNYVKTTSSFFPRSPRDTDS
jgi:steroid 5-alpha reductase family enzyme